MERPVTPEELLAHARWMRPLARSLVGDADAAEDVVQASMAAALARRPDADRPLGPWLARVVRNLSATFRRDEGRRAERETRHAESRAANEPGEDPAASLERLDTQQLLIELVRELEPAQRETIVLAFFEGLSSVEIARRLSIPDATVRWRKQQALEALRAKLGTRFGSREAWCALLAPHALPLSVPLSVPLPTSPAVTSPSSAAMAGTSAAGAAAGAIAMGSAMKFVLAAVLCAAVGAGVWFTRDGAPPTVSAEAPRLGEREASTPVQTEPVDAGGGAREVLEPHAEPARAGGAPASEPEVASAALAANEPVSARVRARFVDTSGQPFDRVSFRATDGSLGPGASATSGSDGRAELLLELRGARRDPSVQFLASREGCATRTMRSTLAPGSTVELGEVVLDREARVRGLVSDEAGNALANIEVGLAPVDYEEHNPERLRRHGSHRFDSTITTKSDARGLFDLGGVPAGSWRLWGHGAERGYGVSAVFDVLPGDQELGVDFVVPGLRPTDSITGIVLDPSGAPVAGADLMIAYESENESGSSGATSDARGEFEFRIYLDVPVDLVARDPSERWAEVAVRDVPPGARGIELRLGDPAAQPKTRVRVSSSAGGPVRAIELESRSGREFNYSETRLATVELEPGLFEFAVPAASFGFTVQAKGFVPSALLPLDPKSLPSEIPLTLIEAPALVGVVRAKGAPVAGAAVEAIRAIDHNLTLNGFPCRMSNHADAQGTSGVDGAFRLELQGKDDVYLRCTAPGFAPTIVGPIRVDPPPASIEIVLGPGGTIEGRVRAKDGSPAVGAIVGVTNGDGHPRTMRSGHEGRFRFDGLAEGQWIVMPCEQEFRTDYTMLRSTSKTSEIAWSCEVVAGRTTAHDLELEQ